MLYKIFTMYPFIHRIFRTIFDMIIIQNTEIIDEAFALINILTACSQQNYFYFFEKASVYNFEPDSYLGDTKSIEKRKKYLR